MKVLVLTSDTLHHNYFIRSIAPEVKELYVLYEKQHTLPKYDVHHIFEDRRHEYETALWGTKCLPLDHKEVTKLSFTNTINDKDAIETLKSFDADLCIVFGTSKIKPNIIKLLPKNSFNLHGGNPNSYRGLDSHLWAIWHGDPKGMATALHQLNEKLDDGPIFKMKGLDLNEIDELYKLRAQNTNLCISLTLDLIKKLKMGDTLFLSRQNEIGRYYSAMPAALKDIVNKKFTYIRGLCQNEI